MISIHLDNEKQVVDFHYTALTQKKGRHQNIISRLEKRQKKSVNDGDEDLSHMYTYLLNHIRKDKTNYSLLIARPAELDSFKLKFLSNFSATLTKPVLKDLHKIFYYKKYISEYGYQLGKLININVCPYCNRSYTFVLGTDMKKGTRFEYDHFYSRAKFPYLGVCLYNLIPSCHICNSNLKHKEDFDIYSNIHPYVDGFSQNIVFSVKPNNIDFINGIPSAYRIKFKKLASSNWDRKKVKAAVRNISTFRLSELYNMHKDYVNEIIQKSVIYNEEYVESLFRSYEGTLFENKEDVYRMILSNYATEKDYSKRVLSKLTADISKELKLLNI